MTISLEQKSLLSEILEWNPIPEDKLVYFRERLRHRLHAAILDSFLERSQERGLKQKDLADRIGRTRAQITRWLGTASNLTLDSISDLMVGLGMDFDGFPFTPIEKTVEAAERETRKAEDDARVKRVVDRITDELRTSLAAQIRQMATPATSQEGEQKSSAAIILRLTSPPTGEARGLETVPRTPHGRKVIELSERLTERTGENRRVLMGEHYA